MRTDTCNGWSNRETWIVNMWLNATPETYDVLCHVAQAFESASEKAEELEHWVQTELASHDESSSMWRDLLSTSLGRVDWYQIAESI